VLLSRATRQGCRLRKLMLHFLIIKNELRKLEPVTQKAEHVAKNWSWKD
jgi:hypothetical protein